MRKSEKRGRFSCLLTWQEATISASDTHLLDIAIYAEGYQGKKAHMRLIKIDVLIDNISISEQIAQQPPKFIFSGATPFSQFQSNSFCKIDKPLIIGFGESVHGNSYFRGMVYNKLYQWIKQKETNLILIELPMEQALAYNQYIHDHNYKLTFPQIDISTQQFLDSLRQYNIKNLNEVAYIIGIDFNKQVTANQNTLVDLFDFLTSIPNWRSQKEIYPLLCQLLEGNDSIACQTLVKQRLFFEKWIGKVPTKCLQRALTIYNQLPKDQSKEIYRDSIMAENVIWTQKFSATKMLPILAHAEHVSKSSIQSFSLLRPMGNYLKKAYGEQFISFMISSARGNGSMQKGDMAITTLDLDLPPIGSLESAGMLLPTTENCWYVPTTSFQNTLQYGRFMGNTYTTYSFYPMNIKARFDGVIFAHAATGSPMSLSLEDGYQLFLYRKQQRKKVYDEIKNIR